MQHAVTIRDAAEQPSKIAYLRANNRQELEFILLTMLENVANDFNVKETFDDNQIEDCFMTIISEFGIIAPEELLYVFRRAKSGAYGPVYNKLDTATVCSWIREYKDGERLQYFQQSRQEKTERGPEFDMMKAYNAEMKFQQDNGKPSLIADHQNKVLNKAREKARQQLLDHQNALKEREKQETEHEHQNI